jgi:hypothetical protein
MKKILLVFISLFSIHLLFATDYQVQIQISNVTVSSHKLYVLFYNTEKNYNKLPFKTYIIDAVQEDITITYTLPEGEYVITVFQDQNDNRKLDTNTIGIPKEPVGISNYSGKGIPGGFNTLKLHIPNGNATIPIKLKKIRN